ncbi:MAG: FAD-linked oxidase C-terminal domain-containing protein [Anaerolineae bacterium]|jgi:glycolate oxidase|nr:FAD-linked oxidase C-terminal domain-containing protein [Anaerolineae bacterium]MDX9829290.1 FAD-linked oxidase C-terminal domain-containing protein [Anaerolineae bacterium]
MLKEEILSQLRTIAGDDNVLTSPEALICYSYDGTFHESLPEAVVSPANSAEVASILALCNNEGVPVITRGMASGLAAATVPVDGGLVLNMVRLNRILEIDRANMMVEVEAGVITSDLQATVEKLGLFYPPDPSSVRHSTIGGNIACNAGGPRCLKYGVTGDYVMALEVVLADGRILETGGKAIKNVTGYDLVSLFIGSEGTLGVITRAILKLIALPEAKRTGQAIFPRLEDASRAVNAILWGGIVPATLELMDETAINCVEDYMHLGLPRDAEAILIIETDGDNADAARDMDVIARICRDGGAIEMRIAQTAKESDDLWRARRSISGSLGRKRPNKLGEDISVPRSAIPDTIRGIKEISDKRKLPIVIFGHAGDGNLHPNILFDKRDPEEWARVQQAVADLFALSVSVGGTLSGEHGVGTLKKPFLESDVGPIAMDVMRSIRRALDPRGILNPGKILD